MIKLICTAPMHGVKKGDEITDAAEVARLSASHASHFVRIVVPDPVEPEAKPESGPEPHHQD